MGYAHGWTLKRDLTDAQWAAVTQAVQRLADDLPRLVAKGPFVEGHVPTRWNERLMVVMYRRRNRPPFRSDPDGHGVLGPDGRSIVVHPGGPYADIAQDVFMFHRTAHTSWCKTNVGFYDHLAAGTLLVVQRLVPGALRIDSTDMDAEHKRSMKAWIAQVLAPPAAATIGPPLDALTPATGPDAPSLPTVTEPSASSAVARPSRRPRR